MSECVCACDVCVCVKSVPRVFILLFLDRLESSSPVDIMKRIEVHYKETDETGGNERLGSLRSQKVPFSTSHFRNTTEKGNV